MQLEIPDSDPSVNAVIARCSPANNAAVEHGTPSGVAPQPQQSSQQQGTAAGNDPELLFWQSIMNSRSAGDYNAYLRTYPTGRFSELAKSRLQELGSPPTTTTNDRSSETISSANADGVTPPIATTSHDLTADDYPEISIRLQEQGTVRVNFVVGVDGSVTQCKVAKSSGKPRLDDGACTMVTKRWRYKPAMQNGKPVAFQLTATIPFMLR